MDDKTFLSLGARVVLHRLDDLGVPVIAEIEKTSGKQVTLTFPGGQTSSAYVEPGLLLHLVRSPHQKRPYGLRASVERVEGGRVVVLVRGRPAPFERRSYLRVAASFPLRFSVVGPDDAVQLKVAIEAPRYGGATRDDGQVAGVAPGLVARLDRIEAKLDAVLAKLGVQGNRRSVSLRQVAEGDISGSGIRFSSSSEVAVGATIDLDLELPESPPVAIHALATVIRCDPSPGDAGGGWCVAAQFSALHDDDRAEIVRFTFDRQRAARGSA